MSAAAEIDRVQECCEIDGLAVNGMAPHDQLTTFDNVACCTVVSRGTFPADNPLHIKDTSVVTDIVEYLSRPWVVNTGTLNNTTATFPYASDLTLSAYYSLNPNWPKTANVYGIRATVCFKVQVLATPQHSGIYRLIFQPIVGNRFGPTNTLQNSYLPYAEMNLSESTEMTLKIPYIHPNTYMVRNDANFKLGRIGFWALTPTGFATGDLPPRYRIWSWLEDVDLIGATSTNAQVFVSQAGIKVKKTATSPTTSSTITSTKASKPITSSKKPDASSKEVKAANLSSVLQAGSVAAKFVGNMIPAISGFAGTTQWALSYAANLAYSFGWAKPKDYTPIKSMFRSINTGQHNVDGSSFNHTMSLLRENALAIAPLGGSDVDEMSLAYILTRYGVTSGFSLSNQAANTDLYIFSVSPSFLRGTSGNHVTPLPTSGTFTVPTITYYANDFLYWKGNIRVRLSAAITKFHSARLLVGYIPTNTPGTTPASTDALNYQSVIWDLRDNPTLEFDIPFIYPRPYAPVSVATGTFFVRILDPLVAPQNVSPTVTFLVEHAAGDDFECARPTVATLIPNETPPASGIFVSQSGSAHVFNTDERSPADLCVGEAINSVKQLISRAYYMGSIGDNTNTVLSNQNTSTTLNGSVLNKWKSCYTFWRGSFDYHLIPNNTSMMVTASYPAVTAQFNSPLSNIAVTEPTALHITVPFYKDVPMVSATTATGTPESLVRIFVSSQSTSSTNKLGIFGHAGEDTQYFFFIGPPVVTANPATATVFNDDFYLWANRILPPGPATLPAATLFSDAQHTLTNPPSGIINIAHTDTYAYEIDEI